jgi:chemotaxis protein methyltransferase CheR
VKNLEACEFSFTDEDFNLIAKTLHNETGIHLQRSKAALVYLRLAKRLRALGLESFSDYCALISSAGNGELSHMCAALTTNVTKFFRERHHFEHLRTKVLPKLLDDARCGKKIRIWSAGCSTGEEPYSIALTILSMMPDARAYDIRILATDINSEVIKVGIAGQYPIEQLATVNHELTSSWTERIVKNGHQYFQFDDAVLRLISFRPLNLMTKWPMRGTFQAIFCCNVVIYFDEETQAKIWSRLLSMLDLNGVLYIGHSERIPNCAALDSRFEENTTYRKVTKVAA